MGDEHLEVVTSGIKTSGQLQSGTGAAWSLTKMLSWKARTSQRKAVSESPVMGQSRA